MYQKAEKKQLMMLMNPQHIIYLRIEAITTWLYAINFRIYILHLAEFNQSYVVPCLIMLEKNNIYFELGSFSIFSLLWCTWSTYTICESPVLGLWAWMSLERTLQVLVGHMFIFMLRKYWVVVFVMSKKREREKMTTKHQKL